MSSRAIPVPSDDGHFVIIWKFVVPIESLDRFEVAYCAAGTWAQFFSASSGFIGTRLVKCDIGTYMTIDEWASRSDHDAFIASNRARYDQLDQQFAAFTTVEVLIGTGTVVAP